MISTEQVAQIRHLFHAEHWKIGTIAAELGLHPDTVRGALPLAGSNGLIFSGGLDRAVREHLLMPVPEKPITLFAVGALKHLWMLDLHF
jgi:hypothetical protein